MRVLYIGQSGDDVRAWQVFLRGLVPTSVIQTSGVFDDTTKAETQGFQRASGVTPDGVVGTVTLSEAMAVGFNPLSDDRTGEDSSSWPPAPAFGPMSASDRQRIFGVFSYVSAPVPGNPEAIQITNGWATSNIIHVTIPQLCNVVGAPGSGIVPFHRAAANQLVKLWADWEQAGLLTFALTWAGSWVPRFVRGSRVYLSNHSWGTAFDINAQWNMLGSMPALKGQKGSVRELVEIANDNGFYWGGHFGGRPDGMHLEIARIIP
jgi:hypothetical protein